MTKLALAPLLAASLALSGCISFGPKVPEQLLTLTATQQLAPGQEQDSIRGRSLLINVPVTPAAIGGQRVPVLTSPTSIAYVKDAQWSEPPARLFARLVSDTVTARTNRVVVSQVQAAGEGNDQLDGELRRFGIDEASRSALVIFDASLTRDGRPGVEKRRFEARVPVATIESTTVGPALNQAANQVAAQVADWVGGN